MLLASITRYNHITEGKQRHIFLANLTNILKHSLGPVYTVRTKFQNFLRSYVEGVYTIQNGAYERNSLKAYSVGGHNIIC